MVIFLCYVLVNEMVILMEDEFFVGFKLLNIVVRLMCKILDVISKVE